MTGRRRGLGHATTLPLPWGPSWAARVIGHSWQRGTPSRRPRAACQMGGQAHRASAKVPLWQPCQLWAQTRLRGLWKEAPPVGGTSEERRARGGRGVGWGRAEGRRLGRLWAEQSVHKKPDKSCSPGHRPSSRALWREGAVRRVSVGDKFPAFLLGTAGFRQPRHRAPAPKPFLSLCPQSHGAPGWTGHRGPAVARRAKSRCI